MMQTTKSLGKKDSVGEFIEMSEMESQINEKKDDNTGDKDAKESHGSSDLNKDYDKGGLSNDNISYTSDDDNEDEDPNSASDRRVDPAGSSSQ